MQESGLMEGGYNHLSPVLIIGIVVFCVPIISNIFGFTFSSFFKSVFTGAAILLIILGAVISIMNSSR